MDNEKNNVFIIGLDMENGSPKEMAYEAALKIIGITDTLIEEQQKKQKQRNVNIVRDLENRSVVIIHDVLFKGKRNIAWKDVKEYLKQYVNDVYRILEAEEHIYIGNDFPGEFTGSEYTHTMKGAVAKAKANASQGIPEMIEIATGGTFRENNKEKHNRNAKFGWYRYDSRFALPVYDEEGEVISYNVFHASLLIRHSEDGKKYLYDIIDIKKETSNPVEP